MRNLIEKDKINQNNDLENNLSIFTQNSENEEIFLHNPFS